MYVEGWGHGTVTRYYLGADGTFFYDVRLDDDQYLYRLDKSRLTKINTISIGDIGTVGADKSKRDATIAALKADIEATELSLRNLKSALVLIEGA